MCYQRFSPANRLESTPHTIVLNLIAARRRYGDWIVAACLREHVNRAKIVEAGVDFA